MTNILFVQNGEYAAVYYRLAKGGIETYRDQKLSIDLVDDLSHDHHVTVLAICDDPHDVVIRPGLRSVGLLYEQVTKETIETLFDEVRPDRLICRTPHGIVLKEAQKRQTPTLTQFADIFVNSSFRELYRNLRLRRLLTGAHMTCISNHSRNASLSLKKGLFLSETRIVPWEENAIQSTHIPKTCMVDATAPRLFYAGLLLESKGLSDLLHAIALLHEQGLKPRLSIVGRDDPTRWQTLAQTLGVSGSVDFLGSLSNADVLQQMRNHDAVIVPSRHSYQEGLPNTLRETLAVRTPLIMSDHPAFSGRLTPDQDCLVFRASDSENLAACVARLARSQPLYARLSQNAAAALASLPFGMFWPQLWAAFIANSDPQSDWVAQNSLAALLKKANAV